MCCSPQIANNLPCYPHSVHLSKGLGALLPVWCHAMTLNCSGNLVRSPRCELRSDSSRSEQLPQGKERTWCFSCSTELRLKTQFKHCRKAGTAGRLCGDEDMKAPSVQSFLRPLPARGMLFIGMALRSMPVPARLLPTSPEISQTTRELRKWRGNTNQTKPQALALLLLHH